MSTATKLTSRRPRERSGKLNSYWGEGRKQGHRGNFSTGVQFETYLSVEVEVTMLIVLGTLLAKYSLSKEGSCGAVTGLVYVLPPTR